LTHTLLVGLGPFDDGLDVFFLLSACIVVTPPMWSFILAIKAKMTACLAFRFAFVALFAPETARKAALYQSAVSTDDVSST
jgi:hypothetical protein